MICPKCEHETEAVIYGNIQVERCTHCKGIWFDMLQAEHLKDLKGSQSVDTGDPEVGKTYDKIDRINCPKCDEPMIRMVDLDQPHIHYESCPTCYGMWFDAGEFTDYKEHTALDFFRDLFTKERK